MLRAEIVPSHCLGSGVTTVLVGDSIVNSGDYHAYPGQGTQQFARHLPSTITVISKVTNAVQKTRY